MKKIKRFTESQKGKDVLTIIIVILVGLSCFGLGRLSKENSFNGIEIESMTQQAGIINSLENTNKILTTKQDSLKTNNLSVGSYVASIKGSVYYPISCSAGKSIKETNKIYFNTSSEAEKANYKPSSSCN